MIKLYHKFLDYFFSLSLGVKTIILILVTVIGISIVGTIATLMLFGMKNSFDSLFYSRTLALSKLQNIKDVYTFNINNAYRDVIDGSVKVSDSYEVLEISSNLIKQKWTEYQNLEESQHNMLIYDEINKFIVKYILKPIPNTVIIDKNEVCDKVYIQIKYLILDINKTTTLFKQKNDLAAINLIKNDILPNIDLANIYLEQLINYQIKSAIYEKEIADGIFETTFWIIFVIIFVVILFSVFLAYFILENIKSLHHNLECQVQDKTKELTELNASLEAKIAYEIKQSRLKDEMLRQQAKLAAMGEMIANIAHQWRQPLNALTMLIQTFALKNISGKLSSQFVISQVDEGLRIAKNMSDTIEEFRNYFKPDKEKAVFSAIKAIEDALFMIEGVLNKSSIKVLFDTTDNFYINGYPNSFIQVIINLLSNSKDILVEKTIDDKFIKIELTEIIKNNKSYCKIQIIDNGGGIELQYLDKLFEPYFTTKHKSVGTGIGLYSSKKIIEEHFSGEIIAQNSEYQFNNN
ncbi:MAG: hypothetical protein RL154_583, partial [Pseudomonadota bacterium]